MMKKQVFALTPSRLALTLALGLGLCAAGIQGAAAEALTTRGGVHPTFDRLVFDWPHTPAYKIKRDGAQVTLAFDAAGDVDLAPLAKAKLTRASGFSSKTEGDKLVVSFTVPAKAQLKDFLSGAAVVIDITGPADTQEAPNKESAKATTKEKTAPPPAAAAPTPEVKPSPPLPKVAEAVPAPETAPKGKAAAPPPLAREAEKVVVPAPVVAPVPVAAPVPPPVGAETAQLPASVNATASPPKPGTSAPPAAPRKAFPLTIGNAPELIASFDPKIDLGTAVFSRGGYAYIVFDRKLALDLANLTAQLPAPRVQLEPVDFKNANGFRFELPTDLDLRANKTGTVWQLYLSRQARENMVSASLIPQPDFALGSRLLLPAIDPTDPIKMVDEIVGDDLIIQPLRQVISFGAPRSYAEFTLLTTAQGMLIKPRIEKITVRPVSDGVEITSPLGLRLSPTADTGIVDRSPSGKNKNTDVGKNIFDLTAWAGKKNNTYTVNRQRLMQTISDVPENERNRARLELARFYFARGMGEETLALIKFLEQEAPNLKDYSDFQALRGAANILAGHAELGLADLTRPELKFLPESMLWQAVAEVQQRNWQSAEEKFALAQNLLAGYPDPFFSKFTVLAIESALAAGKDREATQWLAQVDAQPHMPEINDALNYLHAALQSKGGRQQMAETLWKQAARGRDRLYQIRSELALIDLGVATGSLTAEQAADKLDTLRFAWRGDDLELEILHRLGLFYIEAKNLKAALTVLSQARRLYPASPLAPVIQEEMSDAFAKAFTDKNASRLSPLEALALYQTFGDLMPAGDNRIAIIRGLAEQLVAIDLLDQASGLLEGLVKNDLHGEDSVRVGTRLAAIRLLDHKADAALAALALTPSDGIPQDLANERLFLRARALSELRKDGEALALLENNNSTPARLLRADINMHAQNWGGAAKALLELIGPPPPKDQKVSPDQSNWLVNCAVALSLANDQAGLDRLAIDYGPVLAGVPQNDLFRILTRPEKADKLRDIAAAQSKIAEVDLFRSFLEAYRQAPGKIETRSGKKGS